MMYVPYHIDLSGIPVQESSKWNTIAPHKSMKCKISVKYSAENCIANICTMFMFFSLKYLIFVRGVVINVYHTYLWCDVNPLLPNIKYLWKMLQCLCITNICGEMEAGHKYLTAATSHSVWHYKAAHDCLFGNAFRIKLINNGRSSLNTMSNGHCPFPPMCLRCPDLSISR